MQNAVNDSFTETQMVIRQCRRFSKHSGGIMISPASIVPLIESKFNDWFKDDRLRLRINQESFLINTVPIEADIQGIRDTFQETIYLHLVRQSIYKRYDTHEDPIDMKHHYEVCREILGRPDIKDVLFRRLDKFTIANIPI